MNPPLRPDAGCLDALSKSTNVATSVFAPSFFSTLSRLPMLLCCWTGREFSSFGDFLFTVAFVLKTP